MTQQLLIVESPAKAKTIQKYLGPEFTVLASYGHVRDLVPKEGAVDPGQNFAMHYAEIARNAKHVEAIASALRKAKGLWLATDPDREGEAISWHLLELLQQRKLLQGKTVQRVVFHEITPKAVQEAVAHPRQIAMDLVNAQQARRALDYLVGFNLSPLLWRKVRPGLSAGRVQSAALRLICERENEIRNFVPREYWTIVAQLLHNEKSFPAKLQQWQGKKLEQFDIVNTEQAEAIRREILAALSMAPLLVRQVERKHRQRQPAAPFTTSTLQQEASRKLGFNASRTMRVAQQLYEGVNLGMESVGLITYMRTDAVNLSEDALQNLRFFIGEHFGKEYLPAKARLFKTKAKNAQEAHEAIRPTDILRTPEQLASKLDRDQFRLYELIWKRTVACQMAAAQLELVAVDLGTTTSHWQFRATGSTIIFPGFLALYQEGKDDSEEEEEQRLLPNLLAGDQPELERLDANQHFTEAPTRYNDATLVKTLEAYGIGRPSTYASIIQTLQNREYVALEHRRFVPTDLGEVVNQFLVQHFDRYVDYGFTASLEDELDAISRGEKQWQPVLAEFWGPFQERLEEKAHVSRAEATSEALDENCPQCGKALRLKLGRYGRFVACSGYPDCNYSRPLEGEREAPEPVGRDCPQCGKALVYRQGRYGRFISCSGYPDCKYLESLQPSKGTGITCPQCQQGELIEKRSRYGKIFYSCNTYPRCNYAVWGEPVEQPCPRCRWPVLYKKTTKRRGEELVCPQEDCGFHFPTTASSTEIEQLLAAHVVPTPRPKKEMSSPPKNARPARQAPAKPTTGTKRTRKKTVSTRKSPLPTAETA